MAQLAGFFTVAALVTFGGAYAVLPFVANAAVNRFDWLSADDMVAGLALGESTPGPLIMVNTFVGFLAGYNVEGGLAWGLIGATIATACTFAPSFVFIISGAPLIDRVRTTGAFASSLNGITIAVVGVIAALAVFVARHAAFVDGEPDWLVIVLAALAFVAVCASKSAWSVSSHRVRPRGSFRAHSTRPAEMSFGRASPSSTVVAVALRTSPPRVRQRLPAW